MSLPHPHSTRFAVRQASQQNLSDLSQQSSTISSEALSVTISSESKEKMNKTMSSRQTAASVTKHFKEKIISNKVKHKPVTSAATDPSIKLPVTTTNNSSFSKTNATILAPEINTIISPPPLSKNPVVQVLSKTDSVGLKNTANVAPKSSLVNVNQLMLDFQAKLKAKEDIIKELKVKLKAAENKIIDIQESSMS